MLDRCPAGGGPWQRHLADPEAAEEADRAGAGQAAAPRRAGKQGGAVPAG